MFGQWFGRSYVGKWWGGANVISQPQQDQPSYGGAFRSDRPGKPIPRKKKRIDDDEILILSRLI